VINLLLKKSASLPVNHKLIKRLLGFIVSLLSYFWKNR